ncbi:MAG TPA: hypothetical protein ENH55_07500 [Aurantimonas coralicida]|uniref:Apea-like HEPN domain-containing protein n=2 Tax=root TaxID=1 RepID=A0A9C9NH52_9HYPH|nr:hypothetical protein [Aurantimonas coralicida]HEU01611.1 hypothetical protein [Aurantimonas coralicida]
MFLWRINSYGREISDEKWETIDVGFVNFWRNAQIIPFPHRIRKDDHTLIFIPDFQSLVDRSENNVRLLQGVNENKHDLNAYFQHHPFPRNSIEVPIKTQGQQSDKIANSLYESLCYDLFIICNLCAPSSLNAYISEFGESDGDEFEALSLTSTVFETIYNDDFFSDIDAGDWFPYSDGASWFRRIRNSYNQIPKSRIEKTLFGLMQISKNAFNEYNIILIFYCLETIFDTKAGENFRVIADRIGILLDLSSDKKADLRKKLRTLYDLRSAIVHGGMELSHPMLNDLLDSNVDNHINRMMNACEFGNNLVVVCLRRLMRSQITELKFEERIFLKN